MRRGGPLRLPRTRLWIKLAILGVLGIASTHAVHLIIANRVAGRALVHSQEILGRNVARLVADEAADPLLVDDLLSLRALMRGAVSGEGVAYCFIVRDGSAIASSFPDVTPAELVTARPAGDLAPFVLIQGSSRYLDLVEPILNGSAGQVRVGVDLSVVQATKREVSIMLGVLALGMISVGVVAAFMMGRAIARPVGELVAAADLFDPAREVPVVAPRSRDEIGELTERLNGMMRRLKSAHEEQTRAREKHADTERMAALGTLVAGVAHEVNNPLAGMKNCVRRLQRDELVPSPKRTEYLELMEEGLERIEDVMQHLLDVARPRPLRMIETSVGEIIREGTSLLRSTLARRHVELCAEEGAARVLADRKQASQALLNLLLNAMYVTRDGGEIRVRVRGRLGAWGIAVEDDGPGVPLDARDRILNPFFTTKPEGEGTGLGLSVTKTIIDAHGGELTFEFPARGTVAIIWLPAASDAAAPSHAPGIDPCT